MIKKFLFIFAVILNISLVLGTVYHIDSNDDGVIDLSTGDVSDLEWKIYFQSYGGESGSQLPSVVIDPEDGIAFGVGVQHIEWGDPGYHANWGYVWDRCWTGQCFDVSYTFEHFPSDMVSISKRNVGPGVYNISLIAYGDGPDPSSIEGPGWEVWDPYSCTVPVTCAFGPCEYFETSSGTCTSNLNGASKCPVCKNDPRTCTESDPANGYLCNGVYAEIRFYDGITPLFTITSEGWGDAGDKSYIQDDGLGGIDYLWWTDSTPGIVDIEQTIVICTDECTLGAVSCADGNIKETCSIVRGGCKGWVEEDCAAGLACSNGICTTTIGAASWRDLNDNIVSEAGEGDLVKLVALGEGFDGKNIVYKINEVNGGFLWLDKTVASQTSSEGFLNWRAGEDGDGNLNQGRYYFEASIEGTGSWISTEDNPVGSQYLDVGAESNENPVANITWPEDRQMYFLGTELNFTQDSYDVDDEFIYEWDLGDGRKFTGDSVNLVNWNFTEVYDSPGQKNIILTVRDNREGVGRDQISILILNSTYVLSYIDSPQWGITYDQTIQFNASGSYVASYDHGTKRTTCLAGNCPIETKNCALDVLECNRVVLNTPQNYDGLTFDWLFTNGFTGIQSSEITPNPTLERSFETPSVPSMPHRARLTVSYE